MTWEISTNSQTVSVVAMLKTREEAEEMAAAILAMAATLKAPQHDHPTPSE